MITAASDATRGLVPKAPSSVACAHCGLPVAPGEVEVDAASFCCEGCRSVYAIVQGSGLAGYYAYRDESDARPVATKTIGRKYQELDDAEFQRQHCTTAEGRRSVELLLEGVHCSACVWLVERLGRVVPGVIGSRLDLSRNVVTLTWDPERVQLSALARGLDSLGYAAHPLSATGASLATTRERALLLRLGIAGAAAGNVMLMAFALYGGAFSGMEAQYQALFRWASLAIATPTVFWAGSVFLRGAWAALRTRTAHMDVPVAVGILAGYLGGAVNTIRGQGEIYFDSLCTLIFLLLVGRYLQQTHQRRSRSESELLLSVAPQTATVIESGTERAVPAAGVQPLTLVRVRAGERIPVDGVVSRGVGSVDTSVLTGEPLPQSVQTSDRVYAGTSCEAGELWIRTESAGASTRLGRLMATVETTQRERAPIVRLADRVAGYFVWAILALAALTLLFWLRLDPRHAIDHTVALLVVTCPCALGMATPLAISVALGRASKTGVLFKNGEYVEALAQPGVMIFDKTGTLTAGQPELLAWYGDDEAKQLLRAIEATSTHPLARSVQRAFPENDLAVSGLEELSRGGLRALVNGEQVLVGSQGVVAGELGNLPDWAESFITEQAEKRRTTILLARGGSIVAAAAFGDALRPDTKQALSELRALGFRFEILSGDDQRVVDAVAQDVGIATTAALGRQSPEAKLQHVSLLRAKGERVIMVGDGVNDAGAMAAATVGLAVHGGAEAALGSADVFTTRSGLSVVVDAVVGSRRTLSVIRHGIIISLGYNALGIVLAASGVLSPLVAAIMMPLSSISVVTLALRGRSFQRNDLS
ncbi:MAG: fixI [Polyangiaceae bacterium]|jgi:Cu2+-exporting ATPase|nr:fixI [Polyangiaceae bacterium]